MNRAGDLAAPERAPNHRILPGDNGGIEILFQNVECSKINGLIAISIAVFFVAFPFGSDVKIVDRSESIVALHREAAVAVDHLLAHADHAGNLSRGRASPAEPHNGGRA